MFCRFALAFALFTAYSLPSFAQYPAGTRLGPPAVDQNGNQPDPFESGSGSMRVSGSVHTFDGHPVSGANVQMRDLGHTNRTFSVRTDSSGNFSFFNVSAGSYDVLATSGVDEARDQVNVMPGSVESSVDLRMQNKGAGLVNDGKGTTVSVSQYAVPPKARSQYQKAAEAFNHAKLDEAQSKVNAALSIYPHFAEALTLRGLIAIEHGDRDAAAADFQQSIQYDPRYAMSYVALASVYNSSGRFNESIPVLNEAEKLSPNSWQTYFELSRANVGRGQYQAALDNLDRASRLQGGEQNELPEFHLVRGYALAGLNQMPRAERELQTFLAKKPTGQMADRARQVLEQLQSGATVSASR